MKSLKEIVNEKLKIQKGDPKSYDNTYKNVKDVRVRGNEYYIDMPPYKYDKKSGEFEKTDESREVVIPAAKYYVIKDLYRGQRMHLQEFEDMLNTIGCLYHDYEDFKPEHVLFASDDIKKCIEYMCKELHMKPEELESSYKLRNCYDDPEILYALYTGEEDEDNIALPFSYESLKDCVEEMNEIK